MRLRLLTLAGLVGAVALVVVLTRPGHELTGELGLTPDPAFSAVFGGALYDARTIRDDEGAPDIGYLTADAPLSVTLVAADAGGVARVQLQVDGRVQDTRIIRCPRGACPARVRRRFRPRLIALGVGPHRLVVKAAGRSQRVSQVAGFTVNVGDRPAAAGEIEPRTAPARIQSRDLPRPALDHVVEDAARRGILSQLLGGSRLRLRERGIGGGVVSVLADVLPTRHGVIAVLPQTDDAGSARMQARSLRDLVIDVDLARRRVLGIQPGPASQVTSWTTTKPSLHDDDETPSTRFTPRRAPRLLRLSDRGPAYFTQDGDPVLRQNGRDWPLSFVFMGRATVPKVKAGLRRLGLVRRGHPRYLGYQEPGGALRFDADRGLKTACDANASDIHARVYAPSRTDSFADPDLGDVVLASVHLDHVDGCGAGPALFGFSERAERRLSTLIARGLRWPVTRDAFPLGNAEPLRRDAVDSGHVWLSDGQATGVIVP